MVRTILLVVVPCLSIMTESPVKCIKLTVWRVSPSCRCLQHVLCTLGDAAPATCHFYFGKKKTRAALQPRKMHAWHGMAWTGCGGTLTWRVETREGRRGLTLAGRSQAWCSVVCTSSYNCHYCVYYCIYMLHHMRACVRVPAHRSIDANMKSGRQGYGGWMDRSR